MGGTVRFVLYDVDDFIGNEVLDAVTKEGHRLQKIFNLYDPDSELSRLNSSRSADVSGEMLEVIRTALEFSRLSRGRYDVSKGMEFLARKGGRELQPVSCTYKDVNVTGNRVSLRHPDVLMDLGSIAKGYIVDRLAYFLREQGVESAFIDARGDMLIFGQHLEVVEIQHPREPSSAVATVVLENAAIATSGDYNQFCGSFSKSHIVGANKFASSTVISSSLMDADARATCMFLGDPQTAAQGRPALAVTVEGALIPMNGFLEVGR